MCVTLIGSFLRKSLLDKNPYLRCASVNIIIKQRQKLSAFYEVNNFNQHRKFLTNTAIKMELFKGVGDRFNGITINSIDEPCMVNEFATKLTESLKQWRSDNKRCIWFKVDVKDSAWVPHLAKEGFNFHHAREGYVTMFCWLPPTPHNLPPASHTNLGVGALVLNDKNQLLAVSEKHYDYPHWKLPGGYVEKGEDIPVAAIREVQEETGINATFQSLIAIRHAHKAMFDNSDFYIICLLKPLTDEIKICTREISRCQWMDVNEYLNHPNVHKLNRFIVEKALDYKKKGIKITGEKKTVTFGQWTREMTLFAIEDA